jgi:hypothetical protein
MPEPADQRPDDAEALEGEVVAEVRHLPVPAEHRSTELDRPRPVSVPATVVAATGGFVLGVAAFLLMRVLRRPHSARAVARRRGRLAAKRRGVDVQTTRSFLVDVHLLKR